jgi:hypothetical protein
MSGIIRKKERRFSDPFVDSPKKIHRGEIVTAARQFFGFPFPFLDPPYRASRAARRRLTDAISRQAQAKRERQAGIILDTAETEIAERFVKAGAAYADKPLALHLRAMDMLYEAIKEKGSMLVPSSAVETMGLGGTDRNGRARKERDSARMKARRKTPGPRRSPAQNAWPQCRMPANGVYPADSSFGKVGLSLQQKKPILCSGALNSLPLVQISSDTADEACYPRRR